MHGPIVGTDGIENDITALVGAEKGQVKIVDGDVGAEVGKARHVDVAAVAAVDAGNEEGEEIKKPDGSDEEFGYEMHLGHCFRSRVLDSRGGWWCAWVVTGESAGGRKKRGKGLGTKKWMF